MTQSITIRPTHKPAHIVRHFDGVSMAIHWLTLILIIALYASAWAHEHAGDGDAAATALNGHRTIGLALMLLTIARLIWKAHGATTPPLPIAMPGWQHLLARANQAALYALLLAQPLLGLAQGIARGKAVPLIGGAIPALMARDKMLSHQLHDLHETAAWALLALIGLHAGAALAHHVLFRDGVLRSMLPGGDRRL